MSDHTDGKPRHPSIAWERRDVSFRGVLIGALVGLGLGIALLWGVHGYFVWQQRRLAERKASTFPLAPGPSDQLPPAPRLEALERVAGKESADMALREKQKQDALHSYGPADEEGFVHVPIEQAMQALAGRLPVRKQPEQPAFRENGLLDGGEPSSGRLYREAAP